MKNFLCTAITLLSISVACAQSHDDITNKSARFGIEAGLISARAKISYPPNSGIPTPDIRSKLGMVLGGFAEFDLGKSIMLRPELRLIIKGMSERPQNQTYRYKTNLTYIEIPVNLVYKIQARRGQVLLGGGPAPAFYVGNSVFFYGFNYVTKFDLGMNVVAAYESSIGFSFNLFYDHGVHNATSDKTRVSTFRNQCAGIILGYTF